ncbi:purine permease 1-like isoform X2 [Apium graveolens]|uniref:purine permease 1-like isoform X2 n=1 Tax=Apium graveolens TaxID=4045 RepID=UPI003D7BB6E4
MVNIESETHETIKLSPSMKNILLLINCIVLSIGHCGGPLVTRLYFIHGGKRVWLSSCLLTAGWPFIFVIFVGIFCFRRAIIGDCTTKLFNIRPRLFLASAFIGILTGVDDYIYAYGVARLPVSTVALIIASQLAFTAGSGVLALHTSSDRPDGESKREYVLGFVMTLGAAALYGFILPLVEFTYQKAKQVIDYQLVMEFQMVMCVFATLFCIVGMLINHDFQAIPREARNFELGEIKYYVVLVCSGLIWQFFYLGAVGVIFCSSSLLSGIIIAVLLPVTEVLAVIVYREKFQAEKGVALILSLWGFVSYFYGEIKLNKKLEKKRRANMELPTNQIAVP